jgi:hypothetical protein
MRLTLTLAALAAGSITLMADNSRYVSVTCTNNSLPATVQLQEGETGELISYSAEASSGAANTCVVQKNGLTFQAFPRVTASGFTSPQGTTIAGPAIISMSPLANVRGLLTVKITPSAYDVNKTLILPPGTNQVFVALESSTNLVNWADSTNGVYGSPEVARFFRIRMQTLAP